MADKAAERIKYGVVPFGIGIGHRGRWRFTKPFTGLSHTITVDLGTGILATLGLLFICDPVLENVEPARETLTAPPALKD